MKGSLPPSSNTDFLMARPAASATDRPAPSDPVSVTAPTRSSSISPPPPWEGERREGLEGPGGIPRPTEGVLDEQRCLRHVRRMLEQTDVAGHEAGSRESH